MQCGAGLALVFAALGASCRHTTPPAAQNAASAPAYDQALQAARLFDGLGNLHHPIATASPEAQRFFDQGLTLVYAYNFHEAEHSFERAAELDPKAAMPWWGEALAYGPDYNSVTMNLLRRSLGEAAIGQAEARTTAAPREEQELIAALAQRFSADEHVPETKLNQQYAFAMAGVARDFPNDPDALTLYAESMMDLQPWHLWQAGKPWGNTASILTTLQGVLQRWPDHVGANHLYVHAVEAGPDPASGLAAAAKLRTLVPAAGHLLHMPAHLEMPLGDYAGAVRDNQAAIAADATYLQLRTVQNAAYLTGYYEHNMLFLAAAAGMNGDWTAAKQALDDLAAQPSATADTFRAAPYMVRLRFARWKELAALPAPPGNSPALNFVYHFARGCALAALGRPDGAMKEQDAMSDWAAKTPNGRAFGPPSIPFATVEQLAMAGLAARIAAARGDKNGAVAQWRIAVTAYDSLGYHEPPPWYPVRESLGAALLAAGEARKAAAVFRDDLEMHPHSPRSLFGLAQALAATGDVNGAAAATAEFQKNWKGGALQLTDF